MLKQAAFVMALLVGGAANAQQIMDGSGSAVGDDIKKSVFAALVGAANDPYSAQIADLKFSKSRPELVCGMVNLKNGYGGYTGFKPFGFNTKYGNLLVDQNLSDCVG